MGKRSYLGSRSHENTRVRAMASSATAGCSSLCTLSSPFVGGHSANLPRATLKAVAVAGLPTLSKCRIVSSADRRDVEGCWAAQKTATVSALAAVFAHGGGQAALALVDERLSTEGTGLGLGVSNPLLIWILLGVVTLVWSLFFVYSSKLPSGDDDSGLSL